MEVKVELWLLSADHFREVLPAELVAVFKFAKLLRLLLNRVICQVNELVGDVVEGVFTTAGPDIAILVAVALKASVNARAEAEATEIELPLVHKQWVVDVLLDYESAVAIFLKRTSNYRLNFS